MTHAAQAAPVQVRPAATSAATVFHWLMITLIMGIVVGGAIDARHHILNGFRIESFLTPQHAGLYGPWSAMIILMGIFALRGWRMKLPRSEWLPRGYGISAAGVILFGIGGLFDLYWHERFGFEQFFDSTISPAHIWLVVSAGLIYLGVVHRSHVMRGRSGPVLDWPDGLSLVLGISFLLGLVMWLTFYFDPLVVDYASGGAVAGRLWGFHHLDFVGATGQVAGVTGMLLVTAIIVSFVLTSVSRWHLPAGSITFIILFYAVQKSFIASSYVYLPAYAAAGIAGDAIWTWMRRTPSGVTSPVGYRTMAIAIPTVLFSTYFLIMAEQAAGIIWPPHLWTGVIVLAGTVGLLLSYAIIGPAR